MAMNTFSKIRYFSSVFMYNYFDESAQSVQIYYVN